MHIVLFLAVIGSLLSGLPLKYYDLAFAKSILDFAGSYESIKMMHHAMGTIIIIVMINHIGMVIYVWIKAEKLLALIQMKFAREDIKETMSIIKNLFFFGKKPEFGSYSLFSKLDYFISAVSLIVLSITGIFLMFPVASSSFVSRTWLPISLSVHSSLSILFAVYMMVSHLFNTHLHPGKLYFNTLWLTGTLDEDAMKTWHAREYERLTQSEQQMLEEYKKKSEEESDELKVQKEQKLLEDYLSEGNALAKNKNYADAIVKYKEAIQIYPNYSQARFNLGVAYKMNGQYKEAVIAFKEFTSMDPFNTMAGPAKTNIKELTKALEEEQEVKEEVKEEETDKVQERDKDVNGQDN